MPRGPSPRRPADRFVVPPESDGLEVLEAVTRFVPGLTIDAATALLNAGNVLVEKQPEANPRRRVTRGQRIEVRHDAPRESVCAAPAERLRTSARSHPSRLRIVRDDASFVVIDKPSGMLSAPTTESPTGTALDHLQERFGQVHLLHRLDAGTSGLLVYARDPRSAAVLSEALRLRQFERDYELCVVGRVAFAHREVSTAVRGRSARTHFTLLEVRRDWSRLSARLETGRTHQIRIHASSIGVPVAGDRQHGLCSREPEPRAPRLALHAGHLGFRHPITGEALRFDSPWPPELEAWWSELDGDAT